MELKLRKILHFCKISQIHPAEAELEQVLILKYAMFTQALWQL